MSFSYSFSYWLVNRFEFYRASNNQSETLCESLSNYVISVEFFWAIIMKN